MKPGTIIEFSDKRKATVVYHNLDGYGIIWEEQTVDPNDLPEPQAMLRDEYPQANIECAGTEYTIMKKEYNEKRR